MFTGMFAFDGAECGVSDMKRDKEDADTQFSYLLKEAMREVETCGWCGGGTVLRSVDGLVALLVKRCGLLCAAFFGDVGWQRHKPESPHRLINIAFDNLNHKLPQLILLQNTNL